MKQVKASQNFISSQLSSLYQVKMQKIFKLKAWFPQYLPSNMRGLFLPDKLGKKRNNCILYVSVCILSSIAGTATFLIRQGAINFLMNCVALITSMLGLSGSLKLKKNFVAFHAIVMCGVLGAFTFFSFLEFFFRHEIKKSLVNKNYSEMTLLFIQFLPYTLNLIAGIYTLDLANTLFQIDEKSQKKSIKSEISKKENQKNEISDQQQEVSTNDQESTSVLCSICFTNERNTVIYKCGHRAMCSQCAKIVRNKKKARCPLCRQKILDIIPIYQ